jgi:4-diphosphocytidyl-2-C-methyl-D-erythritol kinase
LSVAVQRRAAAKINLALHVVGRRENSYHELDTVAVFADIADVVEVSPADVLCLSISGRFAAHAPADEENIVLRAARRLLEESGAGKGAAIRLEKNLPAGTGFGGGSADAAAVLHALNKLWGLSLDAAELNAISAPIGADIPMCLAGRALRARGIGEGIDPIEGWPPLPLVLVWPGRPVSTAAVFGALTRRDNAPLPEPRAASTPAELAEWLSACRNDLEAPALEAAPEIGQALSALRETPGCLLARMSGSGSGCFALYAGMTEAQSAAAQVSAAHPEWWVRAATAR